MIAAALPAAKVSPRELRAFVAELRAICGEECVTNYVTGLEVVRLCGEVPGPYRQHPLEAAGLADRF